MKILGKIFPLGVLIVLACALSACEPPVTHNHSQAISEGTVVTYKISGRHYRAEVIHAKDGYVLWSYQVKKIPVFKEKTYRGLLSVYYEEEGFKSWGKFDPAVVDALFPLEPGKEVIVKGRFFVQRENFEYPFYVTITVGDKTDIQIKDKTYPVYVLDYSYIEERPDGTRTYAKTAWYSEEMETALRVDYAFSNKTFSMRIVSLDEPEDFPEDENPEPEGLGTIRL